MVRFPIAFRDSSQIMTARLLLEPPLTPAAGE